MKLTSRLSFRWKIILLAATAAGASIAMVTAVAVWRQASEAMRGPSSQLSIQANVMAQNAAAPLVFDDAAAAEHLLNSLQAMEHIVGASIYNRNGALFASYKDGAVSNVADGHHEEVDPHMHSTQRLHISRKIIFDGEELGKLHLVYNMRPAYRRIFVDAAMTIFIGLLGIGAAVLLALRLQRMVTQPVLDLRNTMAAVATQRDYSVRAKKYNDDELGALTDGFNAMLGQIQTRDDALAEARDRLEEQVAERTRDLGQTKERAVRAAESLRHNQTILRATIQSTADGIMVVSSARRVLHTNQRFCEFWGLDESRLIGTDEHVTLAKASQRMADRTGFIEKIEDIYKTSDEVMFPVELEDGRVLEVFSAPLAEEGGVAGRIWCCHDITSRRAAEREREVLNHKLIESSRRVGMAEVASSVLHNVGNVLNSVNVSASLLSDRLRKLRITNLRQAADLVKSHDADLASFLTDDERGKQLPSYLAMLAEHLTDEQSELTRETASLLQSVEHIKEIISTQQSYTRAGGLLELVDPTLLLADAVRMNRAGLERHGIELAEDYESVPQLNVDKHKLLQILVNLISNAKYAMSDSSQSQRILTLHLGVCNEGTAVSFRVMDTGMGIPQENLTRIFQHGFTTRPDGHGFGLHSAAIAARELGGSLVAESEGPGHGATFTLTIPMTNDQQDDHQSETNNRATMNVNHGVAES